MTGWVKENRLKTLGTVLGIIISLFVIVGFIGPIDIVADKVYENKRPEMMEALDNALEVQELRLEPRLQAIEHGMIEQKTTSDERWIQSMEIQKQILEEVKK